MVKVSGLLFGLLLFSVIIVTLGFTVKEMSVTYNVSTDNQFNKSYEKLDELTELTNTIQNSTQGQTVESNLFIETLTLGAFKSVRLVFGMGALTNSVVQEASSSAANSIGIPAYIPQVILALFIGTITFLVIAAILRSITI
jgi:hypothetical protein